MIFFFQNNSSVYVCACLMNSKLPSTPEKKSVILALACSSISVWNRNLKVPIFRNRHTSRLLYKIGLTSFSSVLLILCSISGLSETISKKIPYVIFPEVVLSLGIRPDCSSECSSEERFGGFFCDKYPNSSIKSDFIFSGTPVALTDW